MRSKGAMKSEFPGNPRQARERFEATGFLGPVGVLGRDACREALDLAHDRLPATWIKGQAARDPAFHRLATHPAILRRVEWLLGPDVMLWGASLVHRGSNQLHPWHTDLETSGDRGNSVSVWVLLDASGPGAHLRIVPGSHRFEHCLQRVAAEAGKTREEVDDATVRAWARDRAPEAGILELRVFPGQAVFFQGRLWHATAACRTAARTALLLQYATPDLEIRIPDPGAEYDWPFRFLDVRPPCIMVRGRDAFGCNEIVDPPSGEGPLDRNARDGSMASSPPVADTPSRPDADPLWPCWIAPLAADSRRAGSGWGTQPLFEGSSRSVEHLSSHLSRLEPRVSPHRPHRHAEEEVIVMLSGEAEVLTPEAPAEVRERARRLTRGSIVYHPANVPHTIRGRGSGLARYLIFKWQGEPHAAADAPLQPKIVHALGDEPTTSLREAPGFICCPLFGGPTLYLHHLQCHLSTLEPGAGYAPHADDYDVAVLVLEGCLETLERRLGPDHLVFYAAGEPHGMRNVGERRATYLVFELHGDGSQAAVDPGRWEAIRDWSERCDRIARRLANRAPAEGHLVLVEDGQLLGVELAPGRDIVPFLERDGAYWGRPADGATAIRELERLRSRGASCLAIAWPAFWWLEHYADFAAHLRSRYRVLSEDEDLVLVDLRVPDAAERHVS